MRFGRYSCENILEIRGTRKYILKFLNGLYGYTSIYNRYNIDAYLKEKEMENKKEKYPTFNTYAKIPETIERFGYNTFGDKYHLEKWGTKYDTLSYYKDIIDNTIETLKSKNTEIDIAYIEFETYKNPPLPWLISASKENPNIILTLKSTDDNKICKTSKYKSGIIF